MREDSAKPERWMKSPAMWCSIAGPPLAMLANLQLSYSVVPWACGSERSAALHVVAASMLLVSIAGVALGARHRAAVRDDSGVVSDQVRLLSNMALFFGVLFSLVIAAQWAAVFVFNPCER